MLRSASCLLISLFVTLFVAEAALAQTQLSELVEIQNAQRRELIGYGLVTGLDRTGDRTISSRGSVFTVQSIANMLENFGITVDADRLRTRNVAAVMVTATIGPYHAPGSEINVTVVIWVMQAAFRAVCCSKHHCSIPITK